MTISGSITIKAATDLPARLDGGAAIEVEIDGLNYTIHLDVKSLSILIDSRLTDRYVPVWDEVTQTYGRIELETITSAAVAALVARLAEAEARITALEA